VKGYRLIDISSDWIIIDRSVQFKESVLHVPQQPHEYTFVLPPIRYYEHAHIDFSSDESSDLEDLDDPNIESIHLDVESVHEDAYVETDPRLKWAKTTL
jgi:hypothetical protein